MKEKRDANDHIGNGVCHGNQFCWRVWRLRSPNKRSDDCVGKRGLARDDRLLLLPQWPPLLLLGPWKAQLPGLEEGFGPLLTCWLPPECANGRELQRHSSR